MAFSYLIVNLIVTLSDEPVYHVLTYTDFLSYVYVVVTLGLTVGSFFLFYAFTICKKKHILSGYTQAKKTERV